MLIIKDIKNHISYLFVINFDAKYKNQNSLFDTLNPYEFNVQPMLFFIVFLEIF